MPHATPPPPADAAPGRPARLISAPWVVPVTAAPIADGAVVLDERETVVAVGARGAMVERAGGVSETRAEGALLPGLVNAHTHLELSWLAGAVPGGDGVIAWTRRLTELVRAAPESAEHAARIDATAGKAALSARAAGAAALGDVGNGTSGWRAMARVKMAGLFFHELVGSRERRTGDAIADAARERAAVPEAERPAGVAAVPAPHAPYSVGPALLRRIFAAARATGRPTSIHLAEDPDELALLRDGTGGWPAILEAMGVDPQDRVPRLGPCAYLESLGAFAPTLPTIASPPPLLVHMVCADADDRRRARAAAATVVLCPRSNLHIGGRLPDLRALIEDGVPLALGTDSLASSPDLGLWGDLRALAQAAPDVPARRWLHAATAGGARALGLLRLGALEPGRRPGLIDVPLAARQADPERALCDFASVPPIQWLASPGVS